MLTGQFLLRRGTQHTSPSRRHCPLLRSCRTLRGRGLLRGFRTLRGRSLLRGHRTLRGCRLPRRCRARRHHPGGGRRGLLARACRSDLRSARLAPLRRGFRRRGFRWCAARALRCFRRPGRRASARTLLRRSLRYRCLAGARTDLLLRCTTNSAQCSFLPYLACHRFLHLCQSEGIRLHASNHRRNVKDCSVHLNRRITPARGQVDRVERDESASRICNVRLRRQGKLHATSLAPHW